MHLDAATPNKTVASASDLWLRSATVLWYGEHRRPQSAARSRFGWAFSQQKSRPEGRLSLVQGAKLLSSRCSSRSSRSSVASGRSGSRSSSSSVGSGRSSSVSSSSSWSSFNCWCWCWGFNYWCWCRSFFFFAASSQSNNHQGGDQQGFFHLFSLIISKNKSILLR